MTKEEAIERLKTDIFKYADFTENPNENEFWMAFDMAIKALEQQSEDAISRVEAVKVASGYCHPSNIAEELAKLPPITPIRPKGHWIEQNDDYYDWYECSECGYGSEGEMQYSSKYDVRTNFCPNCGAKMIEPQEIHCNCTDEEIEKSFIEDVEAVKDLLPMAESEDKE